MSSTGRCDFFAISANILVRWWDCHTTFQLETGNIQGQFTTRNKEKSLWTCFGRNTGWMPSSNCPNTNEQNKVRWLWPLPYPLTSYDGFEAQPQPVAMTRAQPEVTTTSLLHRDLPLTQWRLSLDEGRLPCQGWLSVKESMSDGYD